MNKKHHATVQAVYIRPTSGSIRWADVDALLRALGCYREEGRGSRVRFELGGLVLVLHKPHPLSELKKGAVDNLREFLKQAGVKK